MTTEQFGDIPFDPSVIDAIFAESSSREMMQCMEEITSRRYEIAIATSRYTFLPTVKRAGKVGSAVGSWMVSVDSAAATAVEHQLEDAPQLFTDLYFNEDTFRVTLFNLLTGNNDVFKPCSNSHDEIRAMFNPREEDEILDTDFVSKIFHDAAEADCHNLSAFMTSSNRGKVARKMEKAKDVGIEIGKITAGAWLAKHLL